MYTPSSFRQDDPTQVAALIHEFPLGLLLSTGSEGIVVTPMPFIVHIHDEKIVLVGHMARANPHWKALTTDGVCVVVFQGENGYITPSWYPSKAATHKVVPTWNYRMAEVRGNACVHHDEAWLRAQVSTLSNQMEQGRDQPWSVDQAPPEFIAAQIKALVGIEIVVGSWQGKWKLSQNRTAADHAGVVTGLGDTLDPHAHAALVRQMSASAQ